MPRTIVWLTFLLSAAWTVRAQTVIRTQDGVTIRSTAELLEKTDKRDKYRVTISASNGNPLDLFYAVQKKPQPNGTNGLGKSDPKHFAEVMLTNPGSLKDFMGGTVKLNGDQTSEMTGRDEILFRIPAGALISGEMTVFVRSGKQPEFSCQFTGPLRPRDAFRTGTDVPNPGIPGQTSGVPASNNVWTSSCNNPDQQLFRRPGSNGKQELVMTYRGRQTIWQQTSANVYEKAGRSGARITHEPTADIYTYTHIDGAVCIWRRR
jgi:hypothetical protein